MPYSGADYRRLERARNKPRIALSAAALTTAIVLGGYDAVADDTVETWKTAEAYMSCGRDYVNRASHPTLEGAESACAAKLDAYVAAMRNLVLNAMAEEGWGAAEAQAFSAYKETEARNEARSSFGYSVQQWIAERRR